MISQALYFTYKPEHWCRAKCMIPKSDRIADGSCGKCRNLLTNDRRSPVSMPNHFELPLFIPVRPSAWFVAGFYTAHLGAGFALLTSNVPPVIQLLIITGL